MDVAAWLRALGLERYERAFRENDIDAVVVPALSADDLREIGVASVGHRKRLLAAAAGLAVGTPPRPAERRHLTLMFADLVGSTALSSRLDPEDMREVLRTYRGAAAGCVARFGGHVAQLAGDGVLAYFGWPEAHEDDAERAVRAGLAVAAATGGLVAPDGTPLAARVGIASGLVVVGGPAAAGDVAWALDEAAVGETPNLAARAQALAGPGEVLVADSTRRLLGRLFGVEDLGSRAAKAAGGSLDRAFRVLGERGGLGRFDARRAGGEAAPPMVGRDRELRLLLDLWDAARAGEGRAVLLAGEAGVGKSRLARALLDALAEDGRPCARILCHCSPLHADTALWPVAEQLARAARLGPDDPDPERLAKLGALLRRTAGGEPGEALPLLAPLLGVEAGGSGSLARLTPQQRRTRTLAALVDQLLGLAARRPVLVLFEDLHWVDPTSLELVEEALARVGTAPVLLVLTSRPEGEPASLAGRRGLARVALGRLRPGDAGAIVARLARGRGLPAPVVAEILARTDGVPLFVEEVTKAVLETDPSGAGCGCPPPLVEVPASLQASLTARLDRLAPVREVAQTAACLGRDFDHALLAAVSPLPEAELADALDRLVAAEILFRRGAPPEAGYSFKHALLRDAAYATLLRSRRRLLHARIAAALEGRFPELARAQPELLAQHCAAAGLAAEAAGHWLRAGRSAARRSAMAEAISQLRRGLGLLPALPDAAARARLELDLQVALGAALLAARGEAAPEIGEAYRRARDLARATGRADLEPAALWGLWHYHTNRAELALAREVAGDQLRSARLRRDELGRAVGHRCAFVTALFSAELGPAAEHLERVLALHGPGRRCPDEILLDPRVAGLSLGAWLSLLRGDPELALARGREALAAAEALGRPYLLAVVAHHQTVLAQMLGDRRAVEERATALLALAREQGFAHWLATATLLHGWAVAAGGASEAGIAAMRRGLAAKRATESRLKVPYYQGLLADLLARAGRRAEALRLLDEALAAVDATGERWFEPELHRLRGEAFLADAGAGAAPEAAACYARAAEAARRRGARWWERRAAASLARLRHGVGRPARVGG